MLDMMMDGGFVLTDSKHALTSMGHSHLIEKTETLKIGQTELTIKGQFSHIDKYVDTVGVSQNYLGWWSYDH